MKIGVVGHLGVVGAAVLKAFCEAHFDVVGHDLKAGTSLKAVLDTDILFLCLPTPTEGGEQNRSAIIECCYNLAQSGYAGLVVIKSTVLPGTTEKLSEAFPSLELCHNPEFLTAARAFEDFMEQKAIVVGRAVGTPTSKLVEAYRLAVPTATMLLVEPKVSEAAKYFRNNYLAVKVALANEFYAMCQTLQIEYDDVKAAMLSQGGIEPGHLAVPGPDGKLGFSGMCLPKDIRAMIKHQEWLGLFPNVLAAAEETNQSVRPHDSLCRELA